MVTKKNCDFAIKIITHRNICCYTLCKSHYQKLNTIFYLWFPYIKWHPHHCLLFIFLCCPLQQLQCCLSSSHSIANLIFKICLHSQLLLKSRSAELVYWILLVSLSISPVKWVCQSLAVNIGNPQRRIELSKFFIMI